jgi:predicted permease
MEQATAELSGITASLAERYPETNRNIAPWMTPIAIGAEFVAVMIALLGAVGFVLLIACANVANLLLARAADRARDLTVRVALGASRWRIVRQQLVESVLLASAGGVVGFALSYPGVLAMRNVPAESAPPYWVQFTIDWAVIAYLIALCTGSAIVCALVPAWQATRTSLATTLNDGGRASAGSRSRRRWTGAFVVAQVAGALLLLTGAALMLQNLLGLVRIDAGVDTATLMRVPFNMQRLRDDPGRRLLFLEQLEERLTSRPVPRAALASSVPLGGASARRLRVDGRPLDDAGNLPLVSLVLVGRGYFDVIGAPVLAGRVDSPDDRGKADEHVVVNDRFARMYFPEGAALGKRIRLEQPNVTAGDTIEPRWMTIVGIVGNVRQQLLPSGEFDPVVYGSYAADPPAAMVVLARPPSDSAATATFIGDQVRALDPDMPLLPALTVNDAFARQFWPQRIFGSMFMIFASIALLLTASGLYAVTAYAVSRRTREIGVRVALGADARRVWWAVIGTTLRQLVVGLVVGAAGAAAVARLLPAMLVGTGGANPFAFAGVALLLLGVGLAAGAVPARRAMRLDPVTALQAE